MLILLPFPFRAFRTRDYDKITVAHTCALLIEVSRLQAVFTTQFKTGKNPAFVAQRRCHRHGLVDWFVERNCPCSHDYPFAAATTFSAASFMVSATMNFSPLSCKVLRPCSTLVPSSRSTIGNWIFVLRAALTMPLASVSTRKMPPKILMSTAFTFLSLSRISKACVTWVSLAPPPTSRKLAGIPPAY